MATQAVREFALERPYKPLDPNIKKGLAVVFAVSGSTVTLADGSVLTADDNSVVLPQNSIALPYAFAGIMQDNGQQGNIYVSTPLDLYLDNRVTVMKDWLPEALLAAGQAVTIGDELGYDPATGMLKKHVDGSTVSCAIAQGTYASSSDPQMILVQLIPVSSAGRGGVWSSLAAPGTSLTNSSTETALAVSSAIPAQVLQQIKAIYIDGMTDITGVNGTDKLIVCGYFHKATETFAGASSVKFYTSPTGGGGTNPTANDQWTQRFLLDLHSATKFVASGSANIGALGVGPLLVNGLQGEQTYDNTVGWKITITGAWNAINSGDIVRQQTLTVRLA